MTNTSTLTSFKIPNQIKDDFHTVCKLNQSSMTSEIVRLVTHFISSENTRLKSYQLTSKEINELKHELFNVSHTSGVGVLNGYSVAALGGYSRPQI